MNDTDKLHDILNSRVVRIFSFFRENGAPVLEVTLEDYPNKNEEVLEYQKKILEFSKGGIFTLRLTTIIKNRS